MAYTKVFAIRARLDDRVKYAVNGEKTELDERIVYTADPEKTDTVRFVTTLNCRSAETAFAAMQKTKKKYKKTGGVLGYHFIQSFAPGEVTPEQAHEIGCEFARRLFGEDFEAVIGTHLDKAHPHNHIVVNSVSRTDGHKYHSSPESYYNDVRGTSDALCRENDLSVITPQGKGKHYAEWKAEQGGKPTVRGIIRADIETTVSPIVGNEKQSEDMVNYLLQEFEGDTTKIWQSNIFGRSFHEIVGDDLQAKLRRMPLDSQKKLREALERIINDGSGGLICIIL